MHGVPVPARDSAGAIRRLLVHAVMAVLFVIPLALRLGIAVRLAPWMLRRHAKRRHIMGVNLRYCFPSMTNEQREAVCRNAAERIVFALLDLPQLWFGSTARILSRVSIRGTEHLEAARRSGRAVLLLAPHTAGLEFGGAALGLRYPFATLVNSGRGSVHRWTLRRMRNRYVDCLFDRSDSMLRVVRAMTAGKLFYYLPDQDAGSRRGVFVPFFGRQVKTLLASGRLVALTHAVVVPCVTTLDMKTGRYTVHLHPPVHGLENLPLPGVCARLRSELERLIAYARDDYLWSLRIFQTCADGSANPDYRIAPAARDRLPRWLLESVRVFRALPRTRSGLEGKGRS